MANSDGRYRPTDPGTAKYDVSTNTTTPAGSNNTGTVKPGTKTPPSGSTYATNDPFTNGPKPTNRSTTAESDRYRPMDPGNANYDVSTDTWTLGNNGNGNVNGYGNGVVRQTDGGGTQKAAGLTGDLYDPTVVEDARYRPTDPGLAKKVGHVDENGNIVIDGNALPKPGSDVQKPPSNPSGNNTSNGGTNSGGGGSSGGGSSGGGGTGYTDAQLLAQALSNAGVNMTPYQLPNMQGPNPDWLDHVSTEELRGMLEQLVESQKQQSQNQIDYGVQQGVNELTRAMEDAAPQFQTQRNQISADEARALDNQALYAEARGDRGGIGQAQYNSIQNTAAQNRRAVNDAQVKLSTDTARQIADLRAQGEFQKADQLLSITQNYLSQLMSLEQWALETNLSVDQFNSQLQQWVDEYNLNVQKYLTDLDLSAAQLTGVFANGQQTLAGQNLLRESLATSGSALLKAGVLPSRQQLQAMGMTEVQAKAYLNKTGK